MYLLSQAYTQKTLTSKLAAAKVSMANYQHFFIFQMYFSTKYSQFFKHSNIQINFTLK